jgi:tetratricopeptide (TPR) repeat protein
LRLERNYGEAIRLLQARLAQFHFAAEDDRATTQLELAFTQRLAGDMAGAKVTAEQARNTYERLLREHPESWDYAASLSNAYALIGEKDLALKEAERAIMLVPSAKDAIDGPVAEENLALVQTLVGDNSRAISMLTQLLQKPYNHWVYSRTPITPALLRLDPLWDPLRSDPAFQKLCAEKADVTEPSR